MNKSVLIIAGGLGERLWPLSREYKPKQFLKINDSKSLIEQTINRALKITDEDKVFIITGKRYEESFEKYIPNFRKENIIYEPVGRDTAAAITLGVIKIKEKIGNSIVSILPADPIIKNEDLFIKNLKKAINITENTNNIVIIGIKPNRPETGYGYIKIGNNIKNDEYNVDEFIEKPNLEKAINFLEDGNYLWNSGMFIWSIDNIIDNIKKLLPDIYNKVLEASKINNDKSIEIFSSIDKISFDLGIMEKLKNIICIKSNFYWDDLGAFSALGRINEKDDKNNILIGDIYTKESNDNIIINDDNNTFISIYGVNNLTIVYSNGVFLVYPNNKDDKIKDILKDIRNKSKLEHYRKYL